MYLKVKKDNSSGIQPKVIDKELRRLNKKIRLKTISDFSKICKQLYITSNTLHATPHKGYLIFKTLELNLHQIAVLEFSLKQIGYEVNFLRYKPGIGTLLSAKKNN